jgi:hypothetical protein
MKKINKLSVLILIFIFSMQLYSLTTKSFLNNKGVIINFKDYKESFGMGFKTDAFEKVNNFNTGIVNRFSNDPNNNTNLGIFVEVKVEIEKSVYYILYCMLSEINNDIKENKLLEKDSYIGKTGPTGPLSKIFKDSNICIAVYSFNKDNKIEKLSNSNAFLQHEVYWYNPTFVMNKKVSKPEKKEYDEKAYKKVEFKDFINIFNETPGDSFYGLTKLQMVVDLQNYPIEIDNKDIENIKKVQADAKIDDQKFIDLFKYKIILTYPAVVQYRDKCKLILYIQSELVPYIKNEYKLKDKIKINFIMSYVNTFDQEVYLLVTGINKDTK